MTATVMISMVRINFMIFSVMYESEFRFSNFDYFTIIVLYFFMMITTNVMCVWGGLDAKRQREREEREERKERHIYHTCERKEEYPVWSLSHVHIRVGLGYFGDREKGQTVANWGLEQSCFS